jgi:hypothetical protein
MDDRNVSDGQDTEKDGRSRALRILKHAAGALLTLVQLALVIALWNNDAPQFIYVAF